MSDDSWSDFVSDFMAYTEGAFSPDRFRLWGGIALLAGALERRVWIKMGPRIAFPNLYTLMVAPPGVGKYTIEIVRDLWTEATEPGTKLPAFHVAPDSMSKASLMDNLGHAKCNTPLSAGPPTIYHSLLIAAEEFSILLPGYDLEFIGVLNSIYNNKAFHSESRRTGTVKELKIEFPQLNILGGTQPGWLGSVFPEEAWSTGLASRLIMIYASEAPLKDLFFDPGDPNGMRAKLLRRLGHLSQMYGQMKWTESAAKRVSDWHMAGGPPAPTHSKLEHYNRRRTSLHMPKLALISAVSRTGGYTIDLTDVNRAIAWLTEAESVMPDIFRAMVGKSDAQIIEELHYFTTALWRKNKQEPVHERLLFSFLSQRVPSDKIEKILEIAERSNVLQRMAGEHTYKPIPKMNHGVE